MNRLCVLVCLTAVGALAASSASALEIEVAPKTLVLSSAGGSLTVHTDVAYAPEISVSLSVEGTELACHTFADNLGNLVAQCSKEAAKGAIPAFEGKTTQATVTLAVEDEGTASETIVVKK